MKPEYSHNILALQSNLLEYKMENTILSITDDFEKTKVDHTVSFEEIGSVFDHTGVSDHGNNRDGGYVGGNNYSYY